MGGLGTHPSKPRPGRYLVIPDTHLEEDERGNEVGLDLRAWSSVRQYIQAHEWAGVIHLGDVADWKWISRWTSGKFHAGAAGYVSTQYRNINRFMAEITELTPGARRWAIEGNHCVRPNLLLQTQEGAVFEGLVEPEANIDFEGLGWQYVKHWSLGETLQVGHANFIHGDAINKYHAHTHVTQYGTNVFYGHVHDIQSHTFARKGDNASIVAQSLGCLQQYNPEYMRGRSSKWQQAINTFWFMPDGRFNYAISRIFDGKFIGPDGEYYEPL